MHKFDLYERHGGRRVSDVVSLDGFGARVVPRLLLGLQLHLLEPFERLQVDLLRDLGLLQDLGLRQRTQLVFAGGGQSRSPLDQLLVFRCPEKIKA